MMDNATAIAQWQGYQAMAQKFGLLPKPAPAPSARSFAETIYPHLPSGANTKEHSNG
jgi:hypothetical protein